MKEKILEAVNDFVSTCYTMFKISAGDFAKENFPKLVENVYDETKTAKENLKAIQDMFELNIVLNKSQGNINAAKTIEIFMEGWYNKIKL